MNYNTRKLFEPDCYEIKSKFNEMRQYFALTRNFSLKVNAHIKMLCFLINNLIESDDYLNLIEEKLLIPNVIYKNNNDQTSIKIDPNITG